MSFATFDSFSRRGRGPFKGFGSGRADSFRVPDANRPPEQFDITDDAVDVIYNQVGDRSLAGRVRELQGTYPAASLPELVTMDFLRRRNVVFQFQVPFGGGRSNRGGAVIDFLVPAPGGQLAIRVQGDYWHGKSAQEQYDKQQRLMMQRMKVNGQPIKAVADVWERRVLDPTLREETLTNALKGVEMGR